MAWICLKDIDNNSVVINTDQIDFLNITTEEQKSGAIVLSANSHDVCVGTGNVKYHFTLSEQEFLCLAKALEMKVVTTSSEVEVV